MTIRIHIWHSDIKTYHHSETIMVPVDGIRTVERVGKQFASYLGKKQWRFMSLSVSSHFVDLYVKEMDNG